MFDPWTPLEEAGILPAPPGRAEVLADIRANPYVSPEARRKAKAEAQKAARKKAKAEKSKVPLGSGLNWRRPKGIGRTPQSASTSRGASRARKARWTSMKHGAD